MNTIDDQEEFEGERVTGIIFVSDPPHGIGWVARIEEIPAASEDETKAEIITAFTAAFGIHPNEKTIKGIADFMVVAGCGAQWAVQKLRHAMTRQALDIVEDLTAALNSLGESSNRAASAGAEMSSALRSIPKGKGRTKFYDHFYKTRR